MIEEERAKGRDAVLARPAQAADVDLMRSRDMSGAEQALTIDPNNWLARVRFN